MVSPRQAVSAAVATICAGVNWSDCPYRKSMISAPAARPAAQVTDNGVNTWGGRRSMRL